MGMHLDLNQMGSLGYNLRMAEEEEDINGVSGSISSAETSSSSEEDSIESSDCSSMSSSSDLAEDASSSLNGPLHDLSELMNQLPIKRGLSKFYEGKSQSFTSVANVRRMEDLVKTTKKKNKWCRSGQLSFSPKATIIKKTARRQPSSLSFCIKAVLLNP